MVSERQGRGNVNQRTSQSDQPLTMNFLVCLLCLAHLQLGWSAPQDNPWITKTVVIGDEFPAISIGILNNKTEYLIQLGTSNPVCEDGYTCGIYIYLLEMSCPEKDKEKYLAIEGTTVTNKTVSIQWCRESSNSDTHKDEFVQIQKAIVRPMGDWTEVNATISIFFTMEQPLETMVVSDEDPFLQFNITDSQSQYNSYFNGTCPEDYAGCGIAIRIQINCMTTRKSTDLQLTAVLMNNKTISKNLCSSPKRKGPDSAFSVSKYLNNIKQLLLTPHGNWKGANMMAQVNIYTFHDPGTEETCPESHFDCNNDKCAKGKVATEEDEFTNIDDHYGSVTHCVPWAWICGDGPEFCPDYCNLSQKYCPQIVPSRGGASSSSVNPSTPKYDDWVQRSVFYYSFFAVAILVILSIFFGTGYLIKKRMASLESEPTENSRPHSRFTRIHFFGKLRREVPYQIVQENDR